jgi:RNA polymerase sigma-70 factor (ECF subfamily)
MSSVRIVVPLTVAARAAAVATSVRSGRGNEQEDASLLDGLRRGDSAALGLAYDRHHVQVRAFARRLLGDEASAEDVVQETFVALPAAIRSFRGDSALRTFVLGMVVNQARHHVRAAARRRATLERITTEPLPSPRASPESDAESAELARALVRAHDKLSIDHRAAFVLCEVEERTSAEAAIILRVPEATVRTRLLHARKKLRASLGREEAR